MAVEVEKQPVFYQVSNDSPLAGGASLGPSTPDDVRTYNFWGVSVFSTQAGTLLIEYMMANGVWRSFPLINIAANTPFDQVYRVTRELYRITYTDTSLVGSDVDLQTIKSG